MTPADRAALLAMRSVIADAAHHPGRAAAMEALDRLAEEEQCTCSLATGSPCRSCCKQKFAAPPRWHTAPAARYADIVAADRARLDAERSRDAGMALAADISNLCAAALDNAVARLLAAGHKDLCRVMPEGQNCEELWVDAPAAQVVVGGNTPGRCAYRQWAEWDAATQSVSIKQEWV